MANKPNARCGNTRYNYTVAVYTRCVYTKNLQFDEITITKNEKFMEFNREQLAICYHFFLFSYVYIHIYIY